MRATLCIAAAGILCSGLAQAADLPKALPPAVVPVAVPYNWIGHYLGIDGGFLWGDAVVHDDGLVAAGNRLSGPVIGPLAGFNIQHGGLVWGVEGDWSWTHADGNGAVALDTYHYDLDWTAHLRGRIGIPHDNWLLFAAGGLALAGFDVTESGANNLGGTYTGFTLGGGADVALSPSWVGRAEVLYDNFGSERYPDYTAHLTAWTARVALIYRFGSH